MIIFLFIVSFGTQLWFLISTHKAFRKFEDLEKTVQKKIVGIDCYMYLIRNLTKNELEQIKTIPDEEMAYLGSLRDIKEVAKFIKNKSDVKTIAKLKEET
jgi:hypothetical protein